MKSNDPISQAKKVPSGTAISVVATARIAVLRTATCKSTEVSVSRHSASSSCG